MAELITTRLGSWVAKWVKKEVTREDGTKSTPMDNWQVKSDFRNREPQAPEQAPVVQTQVTPEPVAPTTPFTEPIQAPIQETPVVAPVEPIKAPEVKPVSVPTTPKTEQTAEEKKLAEVNVKTQENNLKTQEQAQNEASKEQAKAGFQWLIDNGASVQQMADYVKNNEQYKLDFAYIAKSAFKNKANAWFFNKYSWMSTEWLYSAIKGGEVTMYSEKYNLLPESQRQALESYKTVKEAPTGLPTTKEEVFNADSPENSVDFSNIENFMAKMFSSDLKGKMEAMRNDDRVVDLNAKLNEKASELEKFDLEWIKASKKLQDELGNAWMTPAMIRATVADYTANRAIERMGMVSDYNRVQGDLASVKDDMEYDMELFKIEDAEAKAKYGMLFEIYESRRSEWLAEKSKLEDRAFQKELTAEEREYQTQRDEFLALNDERAQDKQNEFTLGIKEFENNFTKEILWINQDFDIAKLRQTQAFQKSMVKWDYIDDWEGNLVYVKDWQRINVLSGLWEKIGSWIDWDWAFQNFQNDDGTITTVQTSKATWEIKVQNRNVNGDTPWGYFNSLWNGKITAYGWAYDKYQWLDVDWEVWDPVFAPFSWEVVEAMSHPQYWITVVVKDDATWEKIRYSHLDDSFLVDWGTRFEKWAMIWALWNTWNVLKMNWQKPSASELAAWFGSHLDIVSYDADWKPRSSHETEKYLKWLWQEEAKVIDTYDDKYISLYSKYNNQKFAWTDWDNLPIDQDTFLEQAKIYGDKIAEPWYAKIENLLKIANNIKDLWPLERKYPDNAVDIDRLMSKAGMQELIDLKTAWATFGALSEKEFERIQSSIVSVWPFTSAEKWNDILNDYTKTLESALPESYKTKAPVVDPTGLTTSSWFSYTPSKKISPWLESLFNQ